MAQNDAPFLLTDPMIKQLLENATTIALVGASNNPERASNKVMKFLLSKGKRVTPINPGLAGQDIHGVTVLASVADLPGPVDIVDIFRASEQVPPIVDAAIANGAGAVWMQQGVIHEEAARKAHEAGLKVVMNDCPKAAWPRLGLA